jgi:hypothetical protein
MDNGGVMLVQPEHILSFQLMGIDRRISDPEIGRVLLRTQSFLDLKTRDIVDEADETYKFELIYTMGTQRPIELSPQRWMLIQRVLDICGRASLSGTYWRDKHCSYYHELTTRFCYRK